MTEPRDPRFDPRPGDFRRDTALRVTAVGDNVVGYYLKSGVTASWPWELWRARMGTTPREDWETPVGPPTDDAERAARGVLALVWAVVLGLTLALLAFGVPS